MSYLPIIYPPVAQCEGAAEQHESTSSTAVAQALKAETPEAHISTGSLLLQKTEGCTPFMTDLETAETIACLPLEHHSTDSEQQFDDSSNEQLNGEIMDNHSSPTSSLKQSNAELIQTSLQIVATPVIDSVLQRAGKTDYFDKAADLSQIADAPSTATAPLPLFVLDPVTQPNGNSSLVSLSVPLQPGLFDDAALSAASEQTCDPTAERNDVAELPLGALEVSLPESTDLQSKCGTSEVDFQDNVALPTEELSSMSAILSPLDAPASFIATPSVLAGLDEDAYVSADLPCGVPQTQDCEQTFARNRMEEPVEMGHHGEYPTSDDLDDFETNSENACILAAESYGLAGDADETQLEEVLFSGEPSSSPFPSSSPPRIFSFSPPQDQELPTPPSSSPISASRNFMDEKVEKEAPVSPTISTEQQGDIVIKSIINFTKLEAALLSPPRPPNPKRPTHASQKKQFKKLTTAFRSPLISDGSPLLRKDGIYSSTNVQAVPPQANLNTDMMQYDTVPPELATVTTMPSKDFTASAAKQFKSPVMMRLEGAPDDPITPMPISLAGGTVHSAQTMQSLMAQIQKLKHAIRIKSGGSDSDEKLEALTSKWTTAGREIAWDVWGYVKDNQPESGDGWGNDSAGAGSKRAFDSAWGGEDGRDMKKARYDGWDQDQREKKGDNGDDMAVQDEAPQATHSLGTMLRFMGIAPETLGWNEEEGDFVDTA